MSGTDTRWVYVGDGYVRKLDTNNRRSGRWDAGPARCDDQLPQFDALFGRSKPADPGGDRPGGSIRCVDRAGPLAGPNWNGSSFVPSAAFPPIVAPRRCNTGHRKWSFVRHGSSVTDFMAARVARHLAMRQTTAASDHGPNRYRNRQLKRRHRSAMAQASRTHGPRVPSRRVIHKAWHGPQRSRTRSQSSRPSQARTASPALTAPLHKLIRPSAQ